MQRYKMLECYELECYELEYLKPQKTGRNQVFKVALTRSHRVSPQQKSPGTRLTPLQPGQSSTDTPCHRTGRGANDVALWKMRAYCGHSECSSLRVATEH